MHRLVESLCGVVGAETPYPECATLIDRTVAHRLGAEYVEALRRHSMDALRITDKMPTNFLHLGIVALALPHARIIHCHRNPFDVCMSIYFLQFLESQDYAYNLTNLGHYYRHYTRLMEHWRKVLPVPILDVRYEDLVTDPETWSRRIIDFCKLEWDERCLRFHETDRPVRTASTLQVRQPIYKSSMGRAQKYEKYLGTLREAMDVS
jgi:Sulfotransferase domain.